MSHDEFSIVFPGKSQHVNDLYVHFVREYRKIGNVNFLQAKTMIGVATSRKRIAYVTHAGKDFLHIVIPFSTEYTDNLCFQKIAKVPGEIQFNHHLRLYQKEDINTEVRRFMKLAFREGS